MVRTCGGYSVTATFRREFGDACALAGTDLAERWADWWSGCVRRAAEELLQVCASGSDPNPAALAVRLRLERAADYYRRMLCDPPLRLFSLYFFVNEASLPPKKQPEATGKTVLTEPPRAAHHHRPPRADGDVVPRGVSGVQSQICGIPSAV